MTEQQWLACSQPGLMLQFLRERAGGRKARLFAIACCRRLWALMSPVVQAAVDLADRLAEGQASARDREVAAGLLIPIEPSLPVLSRYPRQNPLLWAARGTLAEYLGSVAAEHVAINAIRAVREAADQAASTRLLGKASLFEKIFDFDVLRRRRNRAMDVAEAAELKQQVLRLRDVFGNPFRRSVVDAGWLAWRDDTVGRLARAAHEERFLPGGTLDGARLGVLADALEEAGCTDEEMLNETN